MSKDDFSEEDMKVCVDHANKLVEISKDMDPDKAMAENLGVVKLSKKCARFLISRIDSIIEHSARTKWFPYGLNLICSEWDIKCMDIGGLPWIEIDFLHDYEKAQDVILPRLSF